MSKQSDQDIFRHRAEQLADAAKRVIDEYGRDLPVMGELLRQLDEKRRRFEEVRATEQAQFPEELLGRICDGGFIEIKEKDLSALAVLVRCGLVACSATAAGMIRWSSH